jgi:hypothetical protein
MSACFALTQASAAIWWCTSGTNQHLRVGEESLTDIALLVAENHSSGEIACHKFNRMDEHHVSGADWLWFFSQGGRYFSVLIQAKKLNTDGRPRYKYLKRHTRGRTQMWRLLDYAAQEHHYPLYCFYNSWDVPPAWVTIGLPWQWGCAVAPTTRVRDHMMSADDNWLDTVGPLSRPWTMLVCPSPALSQRAFPDRVRATIQQLWEVRDEELPPVQDGTHPMMRWVTEPMTEAVEKGDDPDGPTNLGGVVVITAPD